MIERAWFSRNAPVVAPDLLSKLLVVDRGDGDRVVGRIVETEAYTSDDPASHSFRGRTTRNTVMFGPAGRLYIYRSYGIHWCANVVTGADGDGQAVLVRAVEPVEGADVMLRRRSRLPLADGPGKLCQAFGLTGDDDGTDLTVGASSIRIVDDGAAPAHSPMVGPRVGISKAVDTPWRFRLVQNR